MTKQAYLTGMKRLKSEYPNSYGDAKLDVIWEKVKEASDADFADAITQILFEHEGYAPTGKDIKTALDHIQMRRMWSRECEKAETRKKEVEALALSTTEPPETKWVDNRTPEEIAESEAKRKEALAELYAKFNAPIPTEAPETRRARLKDQLHVVTDWKLRQVGERDEVD